MYEETSLIEVRFASIDRCRRGRCRRVEESQRCYFPRRPQERAACRRRLTAAAACLAGGCEPRAFYLAFAIATRPLAFLPFVMPPLCGPAALRIETPRRSSRHPRPRELRLVRFADTTRMHRAFQLACWGGQSICREKKTKANCIISLVRRALICCLKIDYECFCGTQSKR